MNDELPGPKHTRPTKRKRTACSVPNSLVPAQRCRRCCACAPHEGCGARPCWWRSPSRAPNTLPNAEPSVPRALAARAGAATRSVSCVQFRTGRRKRETIAGVVWGVGVLVGLVDDDDDGRDSGCIMLVVVESMPFQSPARAVGKLAVFGLDQSTDGNVWLRHPRRRHPLLVGRWRPLHYHLFVSASFRKKNRSSLTADDDRPLLG
jgi:hypothetical protein